MSRRALSLGLAAFVGALFGAGLVISGMTQPAKVVAFLDPIDGWDPTLAFVMGGAVVVYAVAYQWAKRAARPLLASRFHLPTRNDIDRQLVLGAAIFGVGWGLGGLCPGPGIVAAASGSTSALAFVVAMLAGMFVQHRVNAR
ncbi:MAG TPA: DUF6691 family protein [Kofleriaceae bacterium]|nr:DUF6691 family protein [Kofleriaceae bacterium]